MRSFLLAAKIAAVFTVVSGLLLVGSLFLFMRVGGDDMIDDLGLLRAHQGVLIAERLEAVLAEHDLDSKAVRSLLQEEARERTLVLRLETSEPLDRPRLPRSHGFHPNRHLEIGGRRSYLVGPPSLESWIPVRSGGEILAHLVVRGQLDAGSMHNAFGRGLLYLGALGLVCVLGLAFYLTAPLRRMSRSMDRIAAGEIEHRVVQRGRGEVAAMGRSFNAMADRIRDMLLGQKELMAGVSHELRSPLTRMKLSLELLRERPQAGERIEAVEAEIDTLDALVEELLLASRFDLGSVRLRCEDLELRPLVDQCWNTATASAPQKKMSLEPRIDPDAGIIHADPSLLRRLLGNLFENALRYGREGVVQLAASRRDDQIEISVTDDGPGVPEEHLSSLFEPFFRVDSSRSRKTGASGLGLMIVRRAVESHRGTVRAEANPAGGLRIVFTLPATAA